MVIFERGTQFGRHLIGPLVGTGRFSTVYSVTPAAGADASSSGSPEASPRALKVLNLDLPKKVEQRFLQECAVVATLVHVHVARYHASGIEAGRPWLLTELVRGQNLRKISRDERGRLISIERAVDLVRQVAEGLAAAHALEIVHRDLRPENVIVGPDDLVKVVDFGMASIGEHGVKTTFSERDLVGSLYAAPEWLKGQKAAISNDVYGLGVILYELCTGLHPAAGPLMTPIEVINNHLLARVPPLVTMSTPERPIPANLSALCERMMAKKPEDRCTMSEAAEGLALVQSGLRAPLRAAARNMGEMERPVPLAKTEPAMAASGPTGTIVMPAVPDAAAAVGPAERVEAVRVATPPPAPAVDLPPGPAAPRAPLPWPFAVAPGPVQAPGDRRSSGAPLARPAPHVPAPSRAPRATLAMAAAALALGLVGTGWRLIGCGGATAARAPPSPDPPPVTASATAPPPVVSAAPVPHPRAPAASVRARAPPERPALPFR